MSRSIFENFKINKNCLVPVEFRFIRCKIIIKEKEYDTFEWMDSQLWKELIEATKTVFQTYGTFSKLSAFEPTSTSTPNLKLAFIVKDNDLKQPIFMEPKTGLYESLSNCEKMLIMSVSLNKPEIKLKDLHTALSQQNQEERQIKISSYFV
ncbi:uncharacterized protein LOC124193227 [Daphnia pulex]|uniref:uncharacterized protein LOC124193227 n=1 Tax=Daphnia pulex TaxID=6669 RepID=UPI001EDEB0B8|nr:uncharacterized protein LOC124193227 [Daphnia pulex]XP_046645207.1 uncharacterized protein LOC124335793 isoform X2 [Daphnia pulicaria]